MKNIQASIRDRLLNYAKKNEVPFQRVLTLYMQESLLHRIVSTDYADSIALKGGLLFYQFQGMAARPTKDIDLLGPTAEESIELLYSLLSTAARIEIEDGMRFDGGTVEVTPIRSATEHGGVRGFVVGYLGTAKTRLQVDMGFGDVITEGPVSRPYRTLLGNRSFQILTYTESTVAAEKLDAIVALGVINSRYKDLYDLYGLLVEGELAEADVVDAAVNTFRTRGTALPDSPAGLSEERWASTSIESDWMNYLARIGVREPTLAELTNELLPQLRRIYESARDHVR